MRETEWEITKELKNVCQQQGIKIRFLPQIIQHKKVDPMMRGIHQEYYLRERLALVKNIDWLVHEKTSLDDEDIRVDFNGDRIFESKLAKKDSVKHAEDGTTIEIKCMRSRTIGRAVAEQRAIKYRVPVELLMLHKDQYRADDFTGLITVLYNAFASKAAEGLDKRDKEFLADLKVGSLDELRQVAFFALSKKLISTKKNKVCRRRACDGCCGFVPNYPKIFFPRGSYKPLPPWCHVFLRE
jgi:hypothetical protein